MANLKASIKKRYYRHLRERDRKKQRPLPRIIFLHILKCGGSSVNKHFQFNIKDRYALNSMNGEAFQDNHLEAAGKAEYIGGHFGWRTLAQIKENHFVFTFLREPMSRLRSLYYYCKRHDEVNPCQLPIKQARTLSFVDFCLSDDPAIRAFTDNVQARTLAYDYIIDDFSTMSDDYILKHACDNLKQCDYVGLTETIDHDIPRIAALTNTRMTTRQYHYNKGHGHHKRNMLTLTQEEQEKIMSRIRLDMQLYDYAKELIGNGN